MGDTEIAREGRTYRFVDTAGIRRKAKNHSGGGKLSVVIGAPRVGALRCGAARGRRPNKV